MQQVVQPISIVQTILGEQKMTSGIPFRLSVHCMCVERQDGVLLYHTLTGELLLLSHEEAAQLGELPGFVSPLLSELIKRWFLCPVDTDDKAIVDQVRDIAALLRMRNAKGKANLTGYTILTTLACNARCFYCFETRWSRSTMSEQTALDVARYIGTHCNGKSVHLSWFGGEPLVNARAIDIITDFLRQQGIEYYSTMTSNGYLFDEEMVRRASETWNLKLVQITLDGTEEVYNKRKAYVNPQGSPYRRVLRNIGLLLDAGISVKVRLNMDENNEADLYALMDELAQRFAGKPGFGVYFTVLWEDVGTDPHSYTAEQRSTYAQKIQSLWEYAKIKDIFAHERLMQGFNFTCTADSDNQTTIMPDGSLGRCGCDKDGSIWGSIYSDEVDEEVIKQWKKLKPSEEACKTCIVYPQCHRPLKCPGWPERCSPIEKLRRKDSIYRAVLGAYEDWKASGVGL